MTGLAHYLKLLIRIGLQGALKLERERGNTLGLHEFLEELRDLKSVKDADKSSLSSLGVSGLADQRSDLCFTCKRPIDDECIRMGEKRWHWGCIACATCGRELRQDFEDIRWRGRDRVTLCKGCADREQSFDVEAGFEPVTRLQQYVFLLRVALARLLSVLRSGGTLPHTSGKYLGSSPLILAKCLQMILISRRTTQMKAIGYLQLANSKRHCSMRIRDRSHTGVRRPTSHLPLHTSKRLVT